MLPLWLFKLVPFLNRWSEAAPAACCGMCAQCLTIGATGLTIEAVAAKRPSERS
jgi:hypothetical protein